ncbi:MAG: hypothetical protein AB7O97_00490 [Planctomycetota bacterium]
MVLAPERPPGTRAPIGWLLVLAACSTDKPVGRGVRVDRFSTEARVEAEYRDETYTDGAGASTEETIFRENLQFDFDGMVYHPRLMTFRGVLDLGLEQRRIDQKGVDTTVRSDDDNNRYDLHAALLRDHPYSVHLFAMRNQARVRQSFFPTNDAVITRHGATLMAKEWVVPSQVEVSTYRFDGESGDLRRERRDTLNATGTRNSEALNLHYQVFAQEVDSDLAGGRYDDFQALAGATWRFGDDHRNSITVDGQRREQTGDTQNENTSFGARTRVELGPDLEHRAGVSFGESDFGGTGETTDRSDVFSELEHRLYDSLITTVRGDWMEQSIGAGELRRVGGAGRLAYRKQLSFGQLQANYRLSRSRQDEDGRFGANVTVNDEPHVVAFGNPVFLDNQNVDQARILVTDQSGAIVYSTPTDYLVESIDTATRLVFPVGSAILPGQTILVTYTFASTLNQTFDSDMQYASLQLSFGDVLSVETHWSELDQDLVSGVSDATLDHSTEIGIAARARYLDHNVELEWIDYDSLLTPYSRTRASWYTWIPVDERLSLNANAQAYETRFREEDERERGLSGLLTVSWRAGQGFRWEVRTEVRRSELRTEDGWGTFVQSVLHYQWRQASVEFSLIGSREQWEVSSDRDILRAMVTFRRRF